MLCAAVKCKFVFVDATKVYKWRGSVNPLFFNLGPRVGDEQLETLLCAAVKCKFVPVDAMKVYKGSGSVNSLFFNLGTRLGGGGGGVVTPPPRPL
jgi:hypothetical protein